MPQLQLNGRIRHFEAVLPMPCSLVNQVYYKADTICHFFFLGRQKGNMFLWNETDGDEQ